MPVTYNGKQWAMSHQASVDAVLGAGVRKVSARGSMFFNKDRWTARTLFATLCQSIKYYGNHFSKATVHNAVDTANATQCPEPEVVVATTPDRVPAWLARASIGGNYHEAWHYEFSCRRDLTFDEVYEPLMARWDLLDDWSPYISAVLTWGNLIEDIRIERCGCAKYPGSPAKMADLQNLILKMEEEGRAVSEHRGGSQNDDLSVVMGAFRDLGLGYSTPRQNAVLAEYQKRSPQGWALVTEGKLKPLLDRAITLSAEDDLGHWWLAMEVVALLVTLGQQKPPTAPPPGEPSKDSPESSPDAPSLPSQEEEEASGSADNSSPPPPYPLFKVGDRATVKDGPLAESVVEVVFAGVAHPTTGEQELRYALVEE
jgi:hypothetical protein